MCKHSGNGHDQLHDGWEAPNKRGYMDFFQKGSDRPEGPGRRQNFVRALLTLVARKAAAV